MPSMWPIMVVTCFELKWQQATKQYTKEFRDILNLMQLIRHHLQRIHWFVLCLFFLNRCIVAHYLNISLVHCVAGWFFTCSTIPKKIYRQLAKQHSSQNERIDIIQSNAFYFEFVSFFFNWMNTNNNVNSLHTSLPLSLSLPFETVLIYSNEWNNEVVYVSMVLVHW